MASTTVPGLLLVTFLAHLHSVSSVPRDEMDFYHFTVMDIHNEIVSLEKYRGKVSLVVNVASQCGYTDKHYKSLQLLQELSENDMFNVLAFPCNQFGKQEPESNANIYRFAKDKYEVTFPMFAKVDVIGSNALDAWQYLGEKSGQPPDWNFWKYLVNHKGEVVNAWGPHKDPDRLYNIISEQVAKAKADLQSKKKKKKKKEPKEDL